nr:MAG TPA: hypothetical protein [Caudoviricetes sp.]
MSPRERDRHFAGGGKMISPRKRGWLNQSASARGCGLK